MMRHIMTFVPILSLLQLNPYGSISCIRFEGIISALKVGTLLMFDAAKIQQKYES